MKKIQRTFLFSTISVLISACSVTTSEENNSNSDSTIVDADTLENEISESETPWLDAAEKNIATFAEAVLTDDISTVTSYIQFPLKRDAPLPAVLNSTAFKTYFSTLFDQAIKTQLENHLATPDLIDLTSSNGTIGILSGQMWFNEMGTQLVSINYTSASEEIEKEKLDKKIKNAVHPAVRNYLFNQLIGKTEKYLFRIDELEDGLRYTQWRSDQTMADEPDFMLFHGVSERMGTAGGYQTTFQNKDRTYLIEQVFMSENDEGVGLFLTIYTEKETISEERVVEILNPFDVLPK